MTTDDRSLERAARTWIEEGPTRAPDRVVEAALFQIETTSQERDLRIPWRLPKMSPITRLAIAAVAVIAVVSAVSLVRLPVSQVGSHSPGPATIEGTWEVTFTRDEMLAAGITDSSEDSPANYGHFKLDVHGGLMQITQLTAPNATDSAQYRISGSTLTLTFLSREPIDIPFTVTDTTLTIGRGGPIYLRVKPWTRTGP